MSESWSFRNVLYHVLTLGVVLLSDLSIEHNRRLQELKHEQQRRKNQ